MRINLICHPCSISTKIMESLKPDRSIKTKKLQVVAPRRKRRRRNRLKKIPSLLQVQRRSQALHLSQALSHKRKSLRRQRRTAHPPRVPAKIAMTQETKKAGFRTCPEPSRKVTLSLRTRTAAKKKMVLISTRDTTSMMSKKKNLTTVKRSQTSLIRQ